MGRLTGKVAIITGAGQGIGLGIARTFASENCSLVITGRVAEKLEAAIPDLEQRGARVVASPGDGAMRENAQKAVDAAIGAFGRLDIVVNNAQAVNMNLPLETISDEEFALAFGSGFLASFYLMQAAFPHMKDRGGSIINFGSKYGIHPFTGNAHYAGTKEGIRGMTRVAAKEWGRYKIRVNVLNPGSVTEVVAAYFAANPEEAKKHLEDVALGYFGDPEADIGPVALFLACDDSRYVTGQTINADGGQVML
jgi:NAD(P)-dependent dehydrogenase (short-subunit alcohol dehydrogenase family)